MPLANDLTGLIHQYGGAIAAAAESVLHPCFVPGSCLPDLSALEQQRSKGSGTPFSFYPSQTEKIAGAIAGLKAKKRVWMVCEMGCGKSPMSLAAAWLILKEKAYRILIMCPGHLVRKWRREVEWLLPEGDCRIIRNFEGMRDFYRESKSLKSPMVAVAGKDCLKLGFDVDRPCAASRKMRMRVILDTADSTQPGDEEYREEQTEDGMTIYSVSRIMNIACCPRCGEVIYETKDDHKQPRVYEEYIAGNEPVTCGRCGDRLLTNARGHRSNLHIDRYVQRHMKGVFDLLIADEVHELAGAETCQGNSFGTLAGACRYTISLTGTLIGGKASDLHAPLWRMSPELLNQRGFNIVPLKGSRISAIGRNERTFVRRYGVMEHQIVRSSRGDGDDYSGTVKRGACGRRKSYKTNERPRPGINPDLFNHFLLDRAVFMGLDELGAVLPPLERILVPCNMNDVLKTAYQKLDDDFRTAIKRRVNGKGPPALSATRVQALDAYLDKPWDWAPIKAPVFDNNGHKIGMEVIATPTDLGDCFVGPKDEKLIEVVKKELKEHRRCAVYVQFTGVHDVRPKVLKLLCAAGLRAVILPDTVKPEARESWIEKHTPEMDVLICHPKRVMTGLDLLSYPTLIWYQTGYSTHVLRQASARARRPAQTKPCKVVFLYYAGTIQEQAMALMGEKEAASQALEGVFDTRALQALMNGGKNDDILAALANTLEEGSRISAKAAWQKLTAPMKPVPVAPKPTPKPVVRVEARATASFKMPSFIQGRLF